MSILVEKPSQLLSRQRKNRGRSNLEEAFESAETTAEMIKIFNEMQGVLDEREREIESLVWLL